MSGSGGATRGAFAKSFERLVQVHCVAVLAVWPSVWHVSILHFLSILLQFLSLKLVSSLSAISPVVVVIVISN